MQRSAMRELAFQLIYGIEIQRNEEQESVSLFIENNNIENEEVKEYLTKIALGLKEHSNEIENLIIHNLKEKWSLDRISKVNLSLIKLAIFEMLYLDLPYKVAINEVVELAKKYSDNQAPTFINGILASVVKEKGLDIKNENWTNNSNYVK